MYHTYVLSIHIYLAGQYLYRYTDSASGGVRTDTQIVHEEAFVQIDRYSLRIRTYR